MMAHDTDNLSLADLEQQYRNSWCGFDPHRINTYLERVPSEQQVELLTRLLSLEIEYSYQPPAAVVGNTGSPSSDVFQTTAVNENEEDQRVRPNLALLLLRYPQLREYPEALIRLSVLEFACRLRHDSPPPSPDSYLPLFSDPVMQARVERLLSLADRRLMQHPVEYSDQPTSPSDLTVKDQAMSSSLHSVPLPASLGCFLLLRQLGRGGMGYVYLAVDLRSAALVAVKLMRRNDAWSIHRFHEEFLWLSRLTHPNLVQLYDAWQEGDLRFFSMELIEGKTVDRWFRHRQRKYPHQALQDLRRVLCQVAGAICYLHAHEVIHCDIKCSNVMITNRNQAKLLDLGLAMRKGSRWEMMGTLQYMAPEIFAGHPPTHASDWYSFGVLLYEVLTGEYPLANKSDIGLSKSAPIVFKSARIRQQLLSAGCAPDLAELCVRLCHPDPDKRPTAVDVLSVLHDSGALHLTEHNARLVGRSEEQRRLRHFCETRSLQQGVKLAVIRGGAGFGKTSLLQAFLAATDHRRWIVVKTVALQHDHTPLRLMYSVLRELAEHALRDDSLLHQVPLDPALYPSLLRVFASLRRFADPDRTTAHRESLSFSTAAETRSALREAVRWIANLSQTRKIMIGVDDVDHGDATSIQCLRDLSRDESFRGCVVVTIDNEEFSRIAPLMLPSAQDAHTTPEGTRPGLIELGHLDESACRLLVEQTADRMHVELDERHTKEIIQQSDGIPFLLVELTKMTAAEGANHSCTTSEGTRTDNWEECLTGQEESVLQYLAVARLPLTFHQLQIVTRLPPPQLQQTLDLLASRGWIRSGNQHWNEGVQLAHASFRIPLLARMSDARRKRRHYRMARMLSLQMPPPWKEMGYHFYAAGSMREAAVCYLEEGRQRFAAGDYVSAYDYLCRADHPVAERSAREYQDLLAMKAAAAAGAGLAHIAAAIYDTLSDHALANDRQAEFIALAGEQWIRSGNLAKGLDRLRELTYRHITPTIRFHTSPWSHHIVRARVLVRALRHRHGWNMSAGGHQQFSALERCLARMPLPATFFDSRLGPELLLAQMKLTGRALSVADRSFILLNSALLLSISGRRFQRIALKWLRQGVDLARSSSNPLLLGQSYLTRAVWSMLRGRFPAAERAANAATQVVAKERITAEWELRFTQWLTIGSAWYQGKIQQACQRSEKLRGLPATKKASISQLFAYLGAPAWSDLFTGNNALVRKGLDLIDRMPGNSGFHSPRFFWWISEIYRLLYENQPEAALDQIRANWNRLQREYLFSSDHYRWLALGARIAACLVMLDQRDQRQDRVRRDAQHWIRQLGRLSERSYAAHAPLFQLALQLRDDDPVPAQTIRKAIDRVASHGHGLMANAGRLLLAASDPTAEPVAQWDFSATVRWFHEQGCQDIVATARFLLPLPPSLHESIHTEVAKLS